MAMPGVKFYYIVISIDDVPFYVARDGDYTAAFEQALRFDDRDTADDYRAAMSEKHEAKVLPFTE